MKKSGIIILGILFFCSCRKQYDAPIPDTSWDLFSSALPLPLSAHTRMEGVYNISEGADDFGSAAAAKWSYTVTNTDTLYQLSLFCEKNVAYLICEGRRLPDSTILLNGYWRKMANTQTGKVQLKITPDNGALFLLRTTGTNTGIIITGQYGFGASEPDHALRFNFNRLLYHTKPFELVVHRGGGQTADLLPASENSKEIIRLASSFGATGIEMDVRITKDGVPVLYHDESLSERLIQKNGMIGPVEDYTYEQLYTMVRLIRNGEHIPTLREALQTMVYETPLRFAWLDTKFNGSLELLHSIQQEFMQKAAAISRTVDIRIGIPDQNVLQNFKALPGYANIPSVSELSPPVVEEANSGIWGPRWTEGLQNELVGQVHAEGRKVFVWTLDATENMKTFLTQGNFDGILTNYPSALAYLYYAQQ